MRGARRGWLWLWIALCNLTGAVLVVYFLVASDTSVGVTVVLVVATGALLGFGALYLRLYRRVRG